MAGAGTKLFVDGDILTAAQVNTYLQDQVIMRFANAATRDAAFGGVGEPTLAEGMFCYLDDTNTLQSYNGSAWVNMVSSLQPPALVLLASGTLSSSGTNFVGCFSAPFTDFRIVIDKATVATATDLCWALLNGTTVINNNYYWAYRGLTSSGSTLDQSANNGAVGRFPAGSNGNTGNMNVSVDIYSPNVATTTHMTGVGYMLLPGTSEYGSRSGGCAHDVATAYDGIRIQSAGGQTITGTAYIYGYRNS